MYKLAGQDIDKTGGSSGCIICHLILNFNQKDATVVLTQKPTCFNDTALAPVGKNNYRIHFWDINKFQAVNRMKSAEMGYWDIIKIGKNTQETVSRQKTQQEKHIKK